jgi:hypothetical protein
MAKGTTFINDLMKLIFQATPNIANLLDQAASSPITSLFISLHTASPNSGDQTTSEASYTSYARVGVVRTSSGWTVTGGAATNVAAINFPACTGLTNTITHVAIGKLTSTAGEVYWSGALTSPLSVSSGITPSFAIGALTATES